EQGVAPPPPLSDAADGTSGLDSFAFHLFSEQAGLQASTVHFQNRLRAEPPEDVHERRHETGPSRLVAGPEARPVVAVEVLVEEDQVAPVRVLLELRR